MTSTYVYIYIYLYTYIYIDILMHENLASIHAACYNSFMYTCTITKNLTQVQQKHHSIMLVTGETFTHPKCVFHPGKTTGGHIFYGSSPRLCRRIVAFLLRRIGRQLFAARSTLGRGGHPVCLDGGSRNKSYMNFVEKGIHSKHVSRCKPCNYVILHASIHYVAQTHK